MTEETKATETVAKIETEVVTEPVKTEVKEETWKDGEKFDAAKAQELIDKLRGEVRELKPKAKHADELEAIEAKRKEAEMSELQKAQAEIDRLTKQTKEDALEKLRRKVGEAAKLPADIYEILPEMDEDAMKAKAEQIAKALPKPQPGLSATNPGASTGTVTEAQRRAFLNGGPLPN